MTLINPCLNPNIPPIRIELSDIPYKDYHEQYHYAVRVVKGYWRQATNMTIEDQVEYKTLIEQQQFVRQGLANYTPSSHSVYGSCHVSPTWAKYIFLKSLYCNVKMPTLDRQVQGTAKCDIIEDLERTYRTYCPKQARELKRKETRPSEVQMATILSQSNDSPLLTNTSAVTSDLESLEVRLKEYMDCHLDKIRQSIFDACVEQGNRITTATERISLVMDKMDQLEREQTEYFGGIEKKIDRMAADQITLEEI
ncbi:uncharacterized protein TrAtP1_002818 [Trichoderma atroviride]|uniref:Uncharacterized protein n=1 Tax=Hypocrea atroviridis (strain ATCC 20476 / IMI 206040) TaxID=452589 RepID=G9NX93_HYPAI|nr:uncharacterized protein TRIATDRAFT_308270 [Trichoderma atroviride IMI 206040]EHK44704.1 hypothetical protein TRIATDRAFT_308270 [Trichoderma atroviride IMI 206040]UKZ61559.1 hypothetical protein TrAtP1_002818 [Trichoderma atroviride]